MRACFLDAGGARGALAAAVGAGVGGLAPPTRHGRLTTTPHRGLAPPRRHGRLTTTPHRGLAPPRGSQPLGFPTRLRVGNLRGVSYTSPSPAAHAKESSLVYLTLSLLSLYLPPSLSLPLSPSLTQPCRHILPQVRLRRCSCLHRLQAEAHSLRLKTQLARAPPRLPALVPVAPYRPSPAARGAAGLV